MIRKELHADAGCSVVELDGVRRLFAIAVPSSGSSLSQQTQSALQALQAIFRQEAKPAGSVVMQTVFLKNPADHVACRQMIEEFYGPDLPPTSYIFQPPCDGKLLTIEAWGLAGGSGALHVEHRGGAAIARHNGAAWAYLADVHPDAAAGPICDRSLSAFRAAGQRLHSIGWRFEDVIRTWLYLGSITGAEGETCRYLELNRARTEFYRNLKFGAGLVQREGGNAVFPASTGIGAAGDGLEVSCIALRAERPDVALFPLENPLQISAYDYAHQYGRETPKFVRAMAVATGPLLTTFISGTASITASESRHDDSVEQQTQQTLENIETLIAADSFRRHGLDGCGATLDDLALARVYIKRPEDHETVKGICSATFGKLPAIYVVGDICRAELLVEIEAIAFSRRS
jgi:enamine deaminase RidA (YjgF/YER057c/UK114 family)